MKKLLLFTLILILIACSKGKALKPEQGQFDSEKAFAKANSLLEKKDFEKARELFLEIKSRDETGRYAPMAQLRYADSYFNEKEMQPAIEQYRKFLESNPENKYSPYAQYQIGMAYFSQIADVERGSLSAKKALKEFEELKRLYPRNPYKSSVEMKIARCRELMAGYEFMVGEFYFKKEAWAGAIARLEGILKDFPDFRKEPEVLYMAALSYNSLGEKEKARQYMDLLASKYPDSSYFKEASKLIKKN